MITMITNNGRRLITFVDIQQEGRQTSLAIY